MMKLPKIILFILTPVMLVLMVPGFLSADSMNQISPEDYKKPTFSPDSPSQNGEMPSIENGVPYQFPLVTTPSDGHEFDSGSTDQLAINVWYGNTQTFSQLGSPQLWANILGTVTGLDPDNPAHSLTYTLNGGEPQKLNFGPDQKRLYGAGDFNIELPIGELNPGENPVFIWADDGGQAISKLVTVNYVSETSWPLPYTADWSSMASPQAGAQVTDGHWAINGSGNLVPSQAGYDRIVTLGDYFWKDYEVKVQVTIRSWNTDEWTGPSNGGGVGLAVRWRGHYQTSNEQPRLGWNRLGALAMFRMEPKTNPTRVESAFQMYGNGGGLIDSSTALQMETDKTYWFKMSVQSSGTPVQPAMYRFKVWEYGKPEPGQWTMAAVGKLYEPPTGSVLLVAHQAIVEFGDVEVNPLPSGPFTITVQNPANGQIILDPPLKSSYAYGEQVQARAVGNTGYKLSGWTNSFSGTQNPITIHTTQNITIGANFSAEPFPPSLNITVNGNGTVARDAEPPYQYGQLVTLTPQPAQGYLFAGWGGDLKGTNYPAKIVLDTSKNIQANFVPASVISPKSDDFNACSLNTDLWTFVDPVGDSSYTITGKEVKLSVPAGVEHDVWDRGNLSARIMQATENASFDVVAKFDSVVNQRYQIQGILIEQDATNFLRFDTHYDGQGVRLFIASINDGVPTAITSTPIFVPTTPPYLRVTRVDNQWTYSYSQNGTGWISVASFNRPLAVAKSGVFASNQGSNGTPAPEFTAIVDYFFNTDAPIIPEDGIDVGNFTIQIGEPVGEGTVAVQPQKETYQCNDVVTLTASPADGWDFSHWSGDLSSSSPQETIVVEKNYNVVANFTEELGPPPLWVIYFPMAVGSH